MNFDKSRPERADDVISSVDEDWVGMNICVKFGDSTLNRGLIILVVAGWSRLRTYTQTRLNLRGFPFDQIEQRKSCEVHKLREKQEAHPSMEPSEELRYSASKSQYVALAHLNLPSVRGLPL